MTRFHNFIGRNLHRGLTHHGYELRRFAAETRLKHAGEDRETAIALKNGTRDHPKGTGPAIALILVSLGGFERNG